MFVSKEFLPQKQQFLSSILYSKSGIIPLGIVSGNSDTNLCIKMIQTPSEHSDTNGIIYTLVYMPFVSSLGFCFVSVYFCIFSKGEEQREPKRIKDAKMMDEKTFLKIANFISQNCSIPQLKHLIKIEKLAIDNNREKLVKEYLNYAKTMQDF